MRVDFETFVDSFAVLLPGHEFDGGPRPAGPATTHKEWNQVNWRLDSFQLSNPGTSGPCGLHCTNTPRAFWLSFSFVPTSLHWTSNRLWTNTRLP